MRRLVYAISGHTHHIVGNLMPQLIYNAISNRITWAVKNNNGSNPTSQMLMLTYVIVMCIQQNPFFYNLAYLISAADNDDNNQAALCTMHGLFPLFTS